MAVHTRPKSVSWIHALTVADVMSRNVVAIPATATMHTAACLLADYRASGAPVVDDAGACIGVLSASDFVTFEIDRTGDVVAAHGRGVNTPQAGEYVPWNSVRRFMSTGVQTAAAEATILEACEIMCGEHIHRLFVLNHRSAPIGVVTTLDIASALTKLVQEGVLADAD
jgi:CBS-domain-containing membrane protein